MVVTRKHRNELIKEIIPFLRDDAEESKTVRMKMSGFRIRLLGMDKDEKGKLVQPNKDYFVTFQQVQKVNHSRNLIHILRSSRDDDDMTNLLAEYCHRYGKDRATLEKMGTF